MLHKRKQKRRGAVLPMVALCMVPVIGMMALAIDIGMVAIARSQCQNAADSSSMAGARTINGDSAGNYNFSAVPTQTLKAAVANRLLSQYVNGGVPGTPTPLNSYSWQSNQVTIEVGAYSYLYNDGNTAAEGFQVQFPRTDTTEPYSSVRATVTGTNDLAFGRVFGLGTFNASATSVAVHRPRDIIIIMDLSGSMRFQSLPGIPYSGGTAYASATDRPRSKSMNPDTYYPQFGHYSDTATAALYGNSSYSTGSEMLDPSNYVTTSNSGPPIAEDFHQNGAGVTPSAGTKAFTRAADTQDTVPGGDNFLRTVNNTSGNPYAKTAAEILNGTVAKYVGWENFGYDFYTGGTFNGYTAGPGYWGKTFMIWPPDPRGPSNKAIDTNYLDPSVAANHANNGSKDWRKRFFFKRNTSTGALGWLDHTHLIFDPSGAPSTNANAAPGNSIMRLPHNQTQTVVENGVSTTYDYRINYAAILHWLRNQDPKPFPSIVRAGRIKYYDAIPDPSDTTLNNRWWTTQNLTDLNERFWRTYIDFVLGFQINGTANGLVSYTRRNVDPNGSLLSSVPLSALVGNGDYYQWGTVQLLQKPDVMQRVSGTVNGAFAIGSGKAANINVNNMPADPDPTSTNWYVRFGPPSSGTWVHKTLYKVIAVTTSGGVTTGFRLDDGTNSGLLLPVANGEPVTFFNHQVGFATVGNGVGGGFSSDILVDSLALDPDIQSGAYVQMGNDSSKFYAVTGTTVVAGRVTGIRIENGKGAGLINALPADTEIRLPTTMPKSYDYNDNPWRPRHQFWFGAMTWIDWLGNYNTNRFWWPGNVHEAQCWACKVGIQTAIDDIRNNHPSDFVGMCFFSDPANSTTDASGQHNQAIVPLGRNYQQLKDSLWFPPTTITGGVTEITPYDADFAHVPRAKGGTAPQMGFMISYNLLSSSASNLRFYSQPQPQYRGNAGGLGRKGVSRVVIFETDGAPNTRAYAQTTGSGKDTYYKIRVYNPANYADSNNVQWPASGSYAESEVIDVVKQIVALETATTPGYSTTRKPALVYPIGYGSLFDPANTSSAQNSALDFLQNVAYNGNTTASTGGANFPDTFRIYGTNQQRIDRIRTAFTKIMQTGVQVTLIE